MKRLSILILCLSAFAGIAGAQTAITYDNEAQWKAYEDFNNAFLDKSKYIYKADTKQPGAYHRGNGYRDNDVSGCAAALGFTLAMVLFAGIRERLAKVRTMPKWMEGFPGALITAGLMAVAFMGFGGLIK